MNVSRPSDSRRLLGRLRDVMAGSGAAQERLDKVVTLIAEQFEAEVCSCYVRRAGEVLELFATQGLKQTAVHNTRLRIGEGLVGDIAAHAKPVALADAWSHPQFAYRPETGEDVYHSLAGVPILRGGRVIGVLVVQNREKRHYADEEIETLETVAMVLAELLSSEEVVKRRELSLAEGNATLPVRLVGVRYSGGIGIGRAILHQSRIRVQRLVAEDPEQEIERYDDAMAQVRADVGQMIAAGEQLSDDFTDVMEAFQMFVEDRGWRKRIVEAINSGLTAEAAVQKVQDDTRVRMAQITDPYIRDRLHDIEDMSNRLLARLVGTTASPSADDLPDNVILIARNMGPAELLDYDRTKLRGLLLEEGSATAHVSIVARALDIPVVGRVEDVLDKVEPYDRVIIDGERGQVFVRPTDDIRVAFDQSLADRKARLAAYAAIRALPAQTKDGAQIDLMINAGLLFDVEQINEVGADGIGLYRTEIPFMARSALPNVEAQTDLYRKVFDELDGKPVTFRTLDVGGDKVLPYWNAAEEDNPAMGWRSIRITLDRPMILRHQIRALLRAAEGNHLRLMFPMVTQVAEFDAARHILDREIDRAQRNGEVLPERILAGTMLEVPALLWQLPQLLKRVDFVSIGSNDLIQFLFARDRNNPRIAERYEVLSPPVLAALKEVVEAGKAVNVPVSICGEMAGDPLGALALASIGFRSLSMSVPNIGPVKAVLRSVDLNEARQFMDALLESPDASIRGRLEAFARDHGITL